MASVHRIRRHGRRMFAIWITLYANDFRIITIIFFFYRPIDFFTIKKITIQLEYLPF